jgi:hypothetical protein
MQVTTTFPKESVATRAMLLRAVDDIAETLRESGPRSEELATLVPEAGVARVFKDGVIPTASISVFPAGRAKREGKNYRVSGRRSFNSGIRHAV